MKKKSVIKRLGMQEEFRNWVRERKTLPRIRSFEQIRVGDRFEFSNLSSFEGYKGIVTEIEGDKVWLEYSGPCGEHPDTGFLNKRHVKDYLRFI